MFKQIRHLQWLKKKQKESSTQCPIYSRKEHYLFISGWKISVSESRNSLCWTKTSYC